MASIVKQRDLVVTLKKETMLNLGILYRLHPMSSDLHRYIFKETCLDKPTQYQFNHLSYYLVNIIDPQSATTLSWPLYDAKTEKAYRTDLSNFISEHSSKGLLSPVMSSYLVNPGCFKVTMLIFQLSQLAVQRILLFKMNDCQKSTYKEITVKYKTSNEEGFIDYIDNEIQNMVGNFSHVINKRNILEKIAELLRNRITTMEAKLQEINAHNYINNLVDTFVRKYQPNEDIKQELVKIKDFKEPCEFFDICLTETDNLIENIEKNWSSLITPLLKSGTAALENSKELIGRHTGVIDRRLFTMEYNPQTDEISTKELQQFVNSEQKFILKNIDRNGRLNLPNLIRSFLIAISYILKNNEIGDEIFKFNEYLDSGVEKYLEIITAMKMINERVLNVESKLQVQPNILMNTGSFSRETVEIPPLPDLSDLKSYNDKQYFFDTFTPLCLSKHQFNLRRKTNCNFIKPPAKSVLTTHLSLSKDDFLKTLISCRVSAYDRPNIPQNFHNMSIISHSDNKVNETIAECSTGFTKQQISRLLSTKKTSSSKKFKRMPDGAVRPVQRFALFNESINSNESSGLFRSYSSPNLFDNRETRRSGKSRPRKLSIMQENSPDSILNVSGIAKLDKDSNHSTPQGTYQLDTARLETPQQSRVAFTEGAENCINNYLHHVDFKEVETNGSIDSGVYQNEDELLKEQQKSTETPKTNPQIIKKTSSLEKIINRFKKVRANVVGSSFESSKSFESPKTINTIAEEKENDSKVSNENVYMSRTSMTDVINKNFNGLPGRPVNFYDEFCFDIDEDRPRRPRESLGTILGVDQTFLDQCELID